MFYLFFSYQSNLHLFRGTASDYGDAIFDGGRMIFGRFSIKKRKDAVYALDYKS